MSENRELVMDLNKITIRIDDLVDDGEVRACFEWDNDYEPNLVQMKSLAKLFGCMDDDFYLYDEDVNEKLSGYMVFRYKFEEE